MNEWINVKDYGALGDNSTDDTAAINLAITKANTLVNGRPGTLYFPPGMYKVDPSEIDIVNCNIEAPSAEIIANSNDDVGLIKIGVNYFLRINIGGLRGSNPAETGTRYGMGLMFDSEVDSYPGQCDIRIGEIIGFRIGINFDTTPNFHIGTNIVDVRTIWFCTTGIHLGSNSTGGYQNENNRISVTYMVFCNTSIEMISTSLSTCCQNYIEVDCLELHQLANSNGIAMVGAKTFQNIIKINSIFYNNNTQYIVVTDGKPFGNKYILPSLDSTKVSGGNDIYEVGSNSIGLLNTAPIGRSVFYGPAGTPATGLPVQIGSRYIVNNPTAGAVASYCYTSSGWKVETKLAR